MWSLVRLWVGLATKLEKQLNAWFYNLGASVAKHPETYILCVLLVTAGCGTGLLQLRQVTDGGQLWLPTDADALSHRNRIQDIPLFDHEPRYTQVSLYHRAHGNVLTLDGMEALFRVDGLVRNASVNGKTWETVCSRYRLAGGARGECRLADSVLSFFDGDLATYRAAVSTQQDLLDAVSSHVFSNGRPVNRKAVFGLATEAPSGELLSAVGVSAAYLLRGDVSGGVEDLESELLDLLADEARRLARTGSEFALVYKSRSSVDNELQRVVTSDIPLMMFTYVFMLVFVCATLGSRPPLRSRVALGAGAVFTILLAIVAGYGICAAMDIPFVSLAAVLPFLMVGLGLDDAYIIAQSYDQVKHDNPQVRMAQALGRAGGTIFTTSLTNSLAFLFGSFTTIPAVEYFCLYASATIAFIFLFQVTMFSSMLVIDQRRRQAGLFDLFCCCRAPRACRDAAEARERELGVEEEDVQPHERAVAKRCLWLPSKPSRGLLCIKVCVVVCFLVIFGANVYGITQIKTGFRIEDVTPDDSYLRDYERVDETIFTKRGLTAGIFFLNVPTIESQRDMESFVTEVRALKWTQSPTYCWLMSFQEFYRQHASYNTSLDADDYLTDPAQFSAALTEFLTARPEFQSEVQRNGDGVVTASRCTAYHVPLFEAERQKEALLDIHAVVDRSKLNDGYSGADAPAFVYQKWYELWSLWLVLLDEMVRNFVLCGVAVIVICSVLLVHPGMTLIVAVMVLMIDACILGTLYFWDIKLNSIPVVNLVMSVGLVVDFVVHMSHAFMHHDWPGATRHERVVLALREMGPSIVLGGITTMLGMGPLALAQSEVFRIFFRMFVAIIGYSLLHGLILLPVVLSWVGPSVHSQEDEVDGDEEEEEVEEADKVEVEVEEDKDGSQHSMTMSSIAMSDLSQRRLNLKWASSSSSVGSSSQQQ